MALTRNTGLHGFWAVNTGIDWHTRTHWYPLALTGTLVPTNWHWHTVALMDIDGQHWTHWYIGTDWQNIDTCWHWLAQWHWWASVCINEWAFIDTDGHTWAWPTHTGIHWYTIALNSTYFHSLALILFFENLPEQLHLWVDCTSLGQNVTFWLLYGKIISIVCLWLLDKHIPSKIEEK